MLIRYIDSFINYEKIGFKTRDSFSLKRIFRLAKIFDNPQGSFPAIHISGTKGKGSIASFASSILKEAGFNLLTASDGLAGLELAKKELPEIVLLDIMMPKMDGFAVLTEIKKDPTTKNIKVLILSNLDQKKN